MKDILKILAALIPFVINIIKAGKKAKNEGDEQEFLEALRSGDADKLNILINK